MILHTAKVLPAVRRIVLPLALSLTLLVGSAKAEKTPISEQDSITNATIKQLRKEVDTLKRNIERLEKKIQQAPSTSRAKGGEGTKEQSTIDEGQDNLPLYLSIAACIIAFGIGIGVVYDRKKLTDKLEIEWKNSLGKGNIEEMSSQLQKSLANTMASMQNTEGDMQNRLSKLESAVRLLQDTLRTPKQDLKAETVASKATSSAVLYLSKKSGKTFTRAYDAPRVDCAWELFDIQSDRASFRAYVQGIIDAQKRNDLRALVAGVCTMNGDDEKPIRTVSTDKPGTMRREGDVWVVETEAIITIGE